MHKLKRVFSIFLEHRKGSRRITHIMVGPQIAKNLLQDENNFGRQLLGNN